MNELFSSVARMVDPAAVADGYRHSASNPERDPDYVRHLFPGRAAAEWAISGSCGRDGYDYAAVFRKCSGLWAVRGMPRVYIGRAEDLPVSGKPNPPVRVSLRFRPSSPGSAALRARRACRRSIQPAGL